MMRCIGLFIGCLFSLNIYAEKYVIGAQNLAYFPHYDFASSTDKGVAWSILEALKAKHGAERFGNVLNHKGNGGTEFFSTGPVYDLKKQSANYEQKSIGIDQLKK